ncbi:MAG: tetratricopeptide repeat protein [Caulobacteraceae bacterium]|nr:tetratricopeptide repeat protein [Caulobacteraceae bacterium]
MRGRNLILATVASAALLAMPAVAQETVAEPVDVFAIPAQVREPTEAEFADVGRLVTEAETARGEERFDDAEAAAQQLVALASATYGPGHPVTASSRNILGQIAFMRGDLTTAESIFSEGLEIRRAALGPTHPDVAESLNNLSSVLSWQGRYDEAPAPLMQALDIWRATLGPQSPEVVEGLRNLGRAWIDLARYDDAMAAYEEALAIQTAIDAPATDRASTLRGIGDVAMMTGDYVVADARLTDSLRVLEAAGFEGLGLGLTLTSLGSLRDRQGRADEAVLLHGRATDVFAAILGPEHPFVAAGLENTSGAFAEMGRFDRSVDLQQRALQIRSTAQGSSHPDTSVSRRSLAATLLMAGRPAEALPIAELALADLNASHPDGLESARAELVAARAEFATFPDDPARALPRARRAQERLEPLLGADHPETLEARALVAEVMAASGQTQAAVELRVAVASDGVRRLGPAHPRALAHTQAAVGALEGLGRPAAALDLLRPVLDPERANDRGARAARRGVWRSAVRLLWTLSDPGA